MKKAFLFLSVIFCIFGFSYGQSKISPALDAATQSAQPNEKIQVIVTMSEQYDLVSFERRTRFMSTKLSSRLAVEELRQFSRQSQKDVIQMLFEEGDQVSDIYSHWLFNGISCLATPSAIRDLASHPDVAKVEWDPDMEVTPVSLQEAEFDRSVAGQWGINHIHADQVWETYGYTGKNVVVAIIDSGVCHQHIALANNLWDGGSEYPNHGYNFYQNSTNTNDNYGRGSMVAGLVAGNADNYKTGIAPDAKIMALRITDNVGGSANFNKINRAVEFAIQHGANIVLISACAAGTAQSAEFLQMMQNLNSLHLVAITAAGDAGQTAVAPQSIASPSNCPSPWHNPDETVDGLRSANICVGATNELDRKPPFSSVGPVSWANYGDYNDYPYTPGSTTAVGLIRPDVAAPGINITSLSINSTNQGQYTQFSTDSHGSTSYSAAQVAGVVALLLEANPNLTPEQIDRILEISAVKCEGMNLKNNYYGAGRVDALEAVKVMLSNLAAPTDLTASLNQHTVTLNWTAVSGASSYDVYCNEAILVSNWTGTSYTYQVPHSGTFSFFLKANASDGTQSPRSNYATVFVDPDGPVATNLSGTVSGHQVTLTWEAPQPPTALRYGSAETPGTMGIGNTSGQTYWAQRFQQAELIDYMDTRVDNAEIYLRVAGTYKFSIYDGNPNGPDQKLFETQFTVTSAQVPGWYSIPVTSTVNVSVDKDLWFVAWAGAAVSKPITWCNLSNPNTNASLMSSDGMNWSSYSSAGNLAWMMRAHLTAGVYTYNVQRNGVQVGQNINALTFVENNVPDGGHDYTVTTNYNNGVSVSVPSEPCHVNVNIKFTVTFDAGTGTCTTGSITQSAANTAITLPSATPSSACQSAGYTFVGWSTEIIEGASEMPENLMPAGSAYTPQANETLYAVYENVQGGGWVAARTIHNNDQICIVSSGMATEFNGFDNNNGAGSSVSFNGTPKGKYPFTLTQRANGKWLLGCPGGYLRKNSSGVISLYTGSNPGATCEWSIEIVNGDAIIRNSAANSKHQLVAKQIYEVITAPTKLFACITYDEVQEHSVDVKPIQLFRNSAQTICSYDHSPSSCDGMQAPTIKPVGEGYYVNPVTVTMSTTVSGGQIRYTLTGEDPQSTPYYQQYVQPLVISTTKTVKARVFKNNQWSDMEQQTYTFPAEYANIAAFKAAGNIGELAKITSSMRVTQQYGNYIYVCDETGGLLLFNDYFFVIDDLVDGDEVGPVQGVYNEENGQPMMTLWSPVVKTGGNTPVAPNVVTVEAINSDYYSYDAQLVLLEGVQFAASATDFSSGTLDQEGNTIAAIDQFGGVTCAVSDSHIYDVIGILGVNNDEYRIYPRTNNDIRNYYNIASNAIGEGTMTVDHTHAAEHSMVGVSVEPVEGYHLDNLYYYGANPSQTTAIDMETMQFEMPGQDITVVAVFAVDVFYNVTFVCNSGTCDTEMLTETAWHSGVVLPEAVPTAACAAEGYSFAGWAETTVSETLIPPTLYVAGSVYYPNGDRNLYAVYAQGGAAWTDVTTPSQLVEGDYVITTKYASSSTSSPKYYYLPREGAKVTPKATVTTINAQGVPAAAAHLWTLTKINSTQYSITYTEDDVTYYLKANRDGGAAIEVTTTDPVVGWELSNNATFGLMACFPTPVAKSDDKSVRYLDLNYNGQFNSSWYFHTVSTYLGQLHLFMKPSNIYTSDPACQSVVEAPTFEQLPEGIIFDDSYSVVLTHSSADVTIHYTLDDSDPTASSPVYEGPIEITDDCTVKAVAIDGEGNPSDIVSHFFDFIRRIEDITEFKTLFTETSTEVVKIMGSVKVTYHDVPYLYVFDNQGMMIQDYDNVITHTYTNGDMLLNGLIGRMVVDQGQQKMAIVQDPGQAIYDAPVEPVANTIVFDMKNLDAQLVTMNDVQVLEQLGSKEGALYSVKQGSSTFYVYDLFENLTQPLNQNTYYSITGFVGKRTVNNMTVNCLYPRMDADLERYYNVTCAVDGEGGAVTAEPDHYMPGSTVTLNVTPEAHYEIATVVAVDADNQLVELEGYSFVMPASDVTVTATFQPVECSLSWTISPEVGGSLVVDEEAPYHYGDELHIHAVAASGYAFDYMVIGSTRYEEASITFVITENTSVYVHFIEKTDTDETQEVSLPDGWGWFSAYIEYSDDALEFIKNSIAATSTEATIKSQSDGFVSLEDNVWTGALTTLFNEKMYLISSSGVTFSMTAPLADPTAHPITLDPGWNWIGFISNAEMNLDDAIAGLNPAEDDMIKGQTGFASYSGGAWSGTLATLTPGAGYIYMNSGLEALTFTYPAAAKGTVGNLPVETYWNANPYQFPTNLTMMVTLDASQFVMSEGSHEIGAFVNGECRGAARLQIANGQLVAFLTVTGVQDEVVSFRLYDVENNVEFAGFADEQIIYRADDIHGSVKHPMTLHFRNTGVNEYGEISLYPNPTNGKVMIQGQAIETVKVYNAMGQLLLNEVVDNADQVELNLSSFSAGVYTISVSMTNGQRMNRMVVRE